jgi:hypothetical protein
MSRSRRKRPEAKPASRISSASIVTMETAPARWWARRWVICLFLVAITAAVYSPLRNHPFIDYDDPGYVTNNQHVLSGLNWETLVWSFTTTEQTNWHPLTWLSHALDCQLFGANAGAHHLTNLFLHVLNVVLLFLILDAATGRRGCSLIVAALFALHPFNVDSVAWIAERKNVLSMVFFLLTLAAYGWYARKPNWKRYGLVGLLFILGLLAKPMLVTLPFVLLLADFWPLQRIADWTPASERLAMPQKSATQLLLEKLPLLAISAVSSAVTVIAQKKSIQPLQVMPFAARLENAVASYFLYLWKTVWPSGFAIHYPSPFDPLLADTGGLSAWAACAAGAFVLIVVSWIAWRQRVARPYLVTGWLWYLGTMVPVIGIVQVGMQGMADRYAYVPLIGIFVILSWGAAEAAEEFRVKPAWRFAAAALVIAVLSFLTVRQVGYWRSSEVLWSHAIDVTRDNSVAEDHVGNLLAAQHRSDALPYFEEAARVDAYDPTSHLAVAAHLQDQGRLKDAIQNYKVVVHESTDPQQVVFGYVNLCIIFGELGDFARAHEAFTRAQLKSPELTGGTIREMNGMVTAHPTDEGYLRLGLLLEQVGMTGEARAAYRLALQANPGRAEAQRSLDHLAAADPDGR